MQVGGTACADCVEQFHEMLSRALVDVSGPCSEHRSGPEHLPALCIPMASRTSEGLVNFDSLAGASSYARIASLTISILPAPTGRSPAETEPWGCRPGLSLSRNVRDLVLPALASGKRMGTLITLFVIFQSDWPSLSKDSSVLLHYSFLTRSADRSPSSGGGWPGLSERGPSWLATASSTGTSGLFHPEY
jgi:hypothetical protein